MSSLRAAGRISSRTTFLYPFIAAMSEGVQYVRSPEWDLADRTGLLCREHTFPPSTRNYSIQTDQLLLLASTGRYFIIAVPALDVQAGAGTYQPCHGLVPSFNRHMKSSASPSFFLCLLVQDMTCGVDRRRRRSTPIRVCLLL